MSIISTRSFRTLKRSSQMAVSPDSSSTSTPSTPSVRSFRSTRTFNKRDSQQPQQSNFSFSSEQVPEALQKLAEACIVEPEKIQILIDQLKDNSIYFSYDLEIAQRIGVSTLDWDVTLCRIFINRLTQTQLLLLKTIVSVIKDFSNDSSYYTQIASFLLPPEKDSLPFALSLLDVLCRRFNDVFINCEFDPIYQYDQFSIKASLFAASPRALITMLFFPQQPEPDFPSRLAIYLSVALDQKQIVQELKEVIEIENLSKRAMQCLSALITHLIKFNPGIQFDETISNIMESLVLPLKKEMNLYGKQLLTSTAVTNPNILKSKKKVGDVTDVFSGVFAEQITLLDAMLLGDLDTAECIRNKDKPTLDYYCDIIDNFGRWVSYSIKTAEGGEVAKMRYFIKVGLECLKLNSFNMSYVIYTAVTHFSLEYVFKKLPHKSVKAFEELKRVFDFSKNYVIYRNLYSIAPTPKIPILPLWMGDIIHAQTLFSSSESEHGLYRMDALRTIANVLLLITHSQRVIFSKPNLIVDQLIAKLSIKYQY
ncbi:hypothetical protein EIN_186320 [Entamoeba invadens IP1]|uniref:hypothetical protein n=1 Tax=Entamoeba invadens IP1 TaxID=370355 RepID=UPI0002C3D79A|nr:hypothetical protein EIN_186320 [Entamoeba invadens IP1]ELP94205.1 hypothetical protein EIN_186320 [Entamoeba invadens IP1]|eukprot:XP_004260976.1 hypothetical protein EIN_186320 [Entamoeba invadens IP1]